MRRPPSPWVSTALALLSVSFLLLVLASTGRSAIHSVGVRAGDPLYRELRWLAARGLLAEPLPGFEPLSRAEVFRLLRSAESSRDPRARRLLDRVRPWSRYLDPAFRGVVAEVPAIRDLRLTGSDLRRGTRAPSELDYGSHRFQGVSVETELSMVAEDREFSFGAEGRVRFDGEDAFLRPVVFTAVTESGKLRFVLGRDPLAWGPSVHSNLLLSTNARPLDQLRVETSSPVFLPGPLSRIGGIRGAVFLAHLDDPGRAVADPWILGHRATLAPSRWLVVGATRTILLGGTGNRFDAGLDSVWNLITAGDANDAVSENETDHRMSLDWSLVLWPLFERVPGIDGGRFYGEYGGEDALRGFPPSPSAPAITLGIELTAGPILARAEGSSNVDDTALWYTHWIYVDGYTYRGRVIGHPMGGDSRSLHVDLEWSAGAQRLVTFGYGRQEHGFEALPGVAPKFVDPPVPSAVEELFRVAVETYWGAFPGSFTIEARYLNQSGDRQLQGPEERWGLTLGYRASRW